MKGALPAKRKLRDVGQNRSSNFVWRKEIRESLNFELQAKREPAERRKCSTFSDGVLHMAQNIIVYIN